MPLTKGNFRISRRSQRSGPLTDEDVQTPSDDIQLPYLVDENSDDHPNTMTQTASSPVSPPGQAASDHSRRQSAALLSAFDSPIAYSVTARAERTPSKMDPEEVFLSDRRRRQDADALTTQQPERAAVDDFSLSRSLRPRHEVEVESYDRSAQCGGDSTSSMHHSPFRKKFTVEDRNRSQKSTTEIEASLRSFSMASKDSGPRSKRQGFIDLLPTDGENSRRHSRVPRSASEPAKLVSQPRPRNESDLNSALDTLRLTLSPRAGHTAAAETPFDARSSAKPSSADSMTEAKEELNDHQEEEDYRQHSVRLARRERLQTGSPRLLSTAFPSGFTELLRNSAPGPIQKSAVADTGGSTRMASALQRVQLRASERQRATSLIDSFKTLIGAPDGGAENGIDEASCHRPCMTMSDNTLYLGTQTTLYSSESAPESLGQPQGGLRSSGPFLMAVRRGQPDSSTGLPSPAPSSLDLDSLSDSGSPCPEMSSSSLPLRRHEALSERLRPMASMDTFPSTDRIRGARAEVGRLYSSSARLSPVQAVITPPASLADDPESLSGDAVSRLNSPRSRQASDASKGPKSQRADVAASRLGDGQISASPQWHRPSRTISSRAEEVSMPDSASRKGKTASRTSPASRFLVPFRSPDRRLQQLSQDRRPSVPTTSMPQDHASCIKREGFSDEYEVEEPGDVGNGDVARPPCSQMDGRSDIPSPGSLAEDRNSSPTRTAFLSAANPLPLSPPPKTRWWWKKGKRSSAAPGSMNAPPSSSSRPSAPAADERDEDSMSSLAMAEPARGRFSRWSGKSPEGSPPLRDVPIISLPSPSSTAPRFRQSVDARHAEGRPHENLSSPRLPFPETPTRRE